MNRSHTFETIVPAALPSVCGGLCNGWIPTIPYYGLLGVRAYRMEGPQYGYSTHAECQESHQRY